MNTKEIEDAPPQRDFSENFDIFDENVLNKTDINMDLDVESKINDDNFSIASSINHDHCMKPHWFDPRKINIKENISREYLIPIRKCSLIPPQLSPTMDFKATSKQHVQQNEHITLPNFTNVDADEWNVPINNRRHVFYTPFDDIYRDTAINFRQNTGMYVIYYK